MSQSSTPLVIPNTTLTISPFTKNEEPTNPLPAREIPCVQTLPFFRVPIEIMFPVMDYLKQSCAGASAFYCKDIRDKIGSCFPVKKEDRADLLMLLENEMLDHIACRP